MFSFLTIFFGFMSTICGGGAVAFIAEKQFTYALILGVACIFALAVAIIFSKLHAISDKISNVENQLIKLPNDKKDS